MKRIIIILSIACNPVCYAMEATVAQRRSQENVQDIEAGNARFRHMEQEGLGCRRGCAVAVPTLALVVVVAYFLLLRVFSCRSLGVVE
ncbi:MAG: hypothetical protein ACHQVS_01345 [Candidatus Babeliales bacterium]